LNKYGPTVRYKALFKAKLEQRRNILNSHMGNPEIFQQIINYYNLDITDRNLN